MGEAAHGLPMVTWDPESSPPARAVSMVVGLVLVTTIDVALASLRTYVVRTQGHLLKIVGVPRRPGAPSGTGGTTPRTPGREGEEGRK